MDVLAMVKGSADEDQELTTQPVGALISATRLFLRNMVVQKMDPDDEHPEVLEFL